MYQQGDRVLIQVSSDQREPALIVSVDEHDQESRYHVVCEQYAWPGDMESGTSYCDSWIAESDVVEYLGTGSLYYSRIRFRDAHTAQFSPTIAAGYDYGYPYDRFLAAAQAEIRFRSHIPLRDQFASLYEQAEGYLEASWDEPIPVNQFPSWW